jgi:hypothetical protein
MDQRFIALCSAKRACKIDPRMLVDHQHDRSQIRRERSME